MVFDLKFNSFLIRCAIFLVVVCAVHLLVIYLSDKVSPLYQESVERIELFEKSKDLDTIVFGNSHALGIYYPDSENVFHFLSSSEDIYETFGKMSQVLESRDHLKCSIVSISPLFFLHSNLNGNPQPRYRYYYLWGKEGRLSDDTTKNYLIGKFSRVFRSDKWKSVWRETLLMLKLKPSQNSIKEMTRNGYIYRSYFFDETTNSKDLAKNATNEMRAYISQLEESKIQLIKDTVFEMMQGELKTLTDSNIKFIFVTPSFLPDFFPGGLSSHSLKDKLSIETSEVISSLENQFENVYYFDFLNDSRMSDPSFYYDDHMNEKGATKFTQLLKQTLKDNNLDCGLN